MKYILTDHQSLTASTILVSFKPAQDNGIGFWPGQYAAIRFHRLGRPTPARCFTIVNIPNQAGLLQFAVKVEGKFTRALNQLPVGSSVDIDGSFGEFVYDQQFDQHSVMLAGGIGITPILSIIKSALPESPSNKITLLYSIRNQDDIAFADELIELDNKYPNFRLLFMVSAGPANRFEATRMQPGRISANLLIKAASGDFENTSFFICGPTSFINSMVGLLSAQGTPLNRINTESFTQTNPVVERPGLMSLSRRLVSVYGLAAMAFLVIIGAIASPDIIAHIQAEEKAEHAQTRATPVSTEEDDETKPASTTPSANQNQTQAQTYQQPTSTVS